MKLSVGFDIVYDCPQPTPMILTLNVHYSRVSDMLKPDTLIINPPSRSRLTVTVLAIGAADGRAPQGEMQLRADIDRS